MMCEPNEEMEGILRHCHSLEYGGHFGGNRTMTKVLQDDFFFFFCQHCLGMLIHLWLLVIVVKGSKVYQEEMRCH